MMRRPRSRSVAAVVVAVVALAAAPGDASAWGRRHRWKGQGGPWEGYAVPLQSVYQFPAAFVFQPTAPGGYAVPLQSVEQFPAAFVTQPGGQWAPPSLDAPPPAPVILGTGPMP